MPSLVEELQSLAADSAVPVTDLLRRVKIAATKLGLSEPVAWVQSELNGYGGEEVPDYRLVPSQMVYFNSFQRAWFPVIFENPSLSETASKPQAIKQTIRELEDLERTAEPLLYFRVSDQLQRSLMAVGIPGEARIQFGRSSLVVILDAVRTRILDWALDLENAGIRGEGVSFSVKEKEIAQQAASTTTNFYGNVGNIAGPMGTSSGPVSINAKQHNTTILNRTDARKLAVLLREGARVVSAADGALLSQMADEIDDTAESESPDPGRFHQTLRLALSFIPRLVSWAGRTVAEGEIHRLLGGG